MAETKDCVGLTSWDFPFKGKETSSWVVGQLWCMWWAEYYLIDQIRGHWGFEDAKAQLGQIFEVWSGTKTKG